MLCLVKTWTSLKNIFRHFFGIHEDKALHQNWIFWIVVLVPLSIICWLVYTLTQDLISDGLYNPHVSSESLASFVNYYAFPITMLTVPLTLAVMINRFHSSKQKAKSNRLVEINNAANNYFSHFQHFKTYIQNIENSDSLNTTKIEMDSIPSLYRAFFTNSTLKNNNFDIPKFVADDFLNKLKQEVHSYKEHVDGQTNKENIFYNLQFDLELMKTKEAVVNSTSKFYKTYHSYVLIYMQIFEFEGVANSEEITNYFEDSVQKCFYDNFHTITENVNFKGQILTPPKLVLKGIE